MRNNLQIWDKHTSAAYLGVTGQTIYNYVKAGKLEGVMIRHKMFVTNSSLEALKKSLNGSKIKAGRPRKEK